MIYTPAHFREGRPEILCDFIARHGFATLMTVGTSGTAVSHVPLLHDPSGGPQGRLLGHLARANPQLRDLAEGREALAIFHGPHAYVSPRWYHTTLAVPTWNYAVVHVRGAARAIDDAAGLREIVGRLSARYEAAAAAPWRIDDQPETYLGGMLRGIGGFEIVIAAIEGKFKLSQNRSTEDQAAVADQLAAADSADDRAVAELMRLRNDPLKS